MFKKHFPLLLNLHKEDLDMAKKNKVSYLEILKDGIITKNPTFIQLLGMCPTLAVTTTVANGIGMGLSATFVLICSNFFISVLRKFIPNKIRIASYIVIIAGFVSTVEMIINAWLPELSKSLGLFIPLIVVNCIILARTEAFASKNSPLPSAVDGLASGIGFIEGVVITLLLLVFTLKVLGKLDTIVRKGAKEVDLYIEFVDNKGLLSFCDKMKTDGHKIVKMQIGKCESENDFPNALFSIRMKDRDHIAKLAVELRRLKYVKSVEEL